jgi:hypothetical protein
MKIPEDILSTLTDEQKKKPEEPVLRQRLRQ